MTVDWLSGAAMLLSGGVIGFLFIYSMKWSASARTKMPADRSRDGIAPSPSNEATPDGAASPALPGSSDVRDLRARRDALIEQLREIDDNPAERERLEREAAGVLRALDAASGSAVQRPEAVARARADRAESRNPPAINPAVKGFVWGVLSMGAVAGIGWYVSNSATPRDDSKPVTGAANPQSTMQQQPAQSDGELRALEAAVKQHPEDLKARDELAKAYFDRENLMGVFEQTKFVLERAPNDPRALTYGALVRMAMGQSGPALGMLQNATKNDPSLTDGWIALAWLQTQSGHEEEAAAAIASAIRQHPDDRARLENILAQMRARGAASRSETTAAGAAQPDNRAGAGAGAVTGPAVEITLSLAPGARVPASGVVFVYARTAGVTSGPPAAVKRLPLGNFPVTLQLSAADSMMGQPLPASMRIEARIDSDGNPVTHDPADISAAQDGVTAGTAVRLALK